MSRKFIVTLLGLGMSLIWAIFKFDISYLFAAFGFASSYITGNVVQNAIRQK
jgi:hypothetical protein